MTNKRQLKKYINHVCSDIAEVILPNAAVTKKIDDNEASDILMNLSRLQTNALSHLNVAFDKAPKSFANVKEYRQAKQNYYNTAYAAALKEFEDGVDKLLQPLNKK